MAESQLRPVIRHIRKLASLQPGSRGLSPRPQTDGQLLGEFSARRDEAAFAALVERHGGLVLSVCRHVLRHQQDAEDAFQATFLVLARKADSIRHREALASWLHGVAYRTAMKAKRDAARRRKYEEQVKAMAPTTYLANPQAGDAQAGDLAWREVQALFDEELQRLAEVYRAPFILCCLEGRSRAEAAEQLGVKEGTVSSRLARARQQLQKRLARRGVALAAVLGVGFIHNAGAATPWLVDATVKAALLFITGKAGVSAQAICLAEGAMKAMTLTKLKAGVMWALGWSLLGAGAGLAAFQAIPSNPVTPATDGPVKALVGRGQETRAQRDGREESRAQRTDQFGDPLPPGALARMGTVRLRHTHPNLLTTAFSPDGKILASGGWNEIRLWDLATGKLVREIRDDGNRTKSYCPLLFAPDGRWLAGACRDSVCIWDSATGRRLQEFPAKGQAIARSKDGKLLATSMEDGSVAVWNTATGKQIAVLRRGHADKVHSITFTADGTGLVTMSGNNRVCHWDLTESKLRKAIDMPIPPDHGVLLSPDGQTVAVAPREGPTSLWDTTTGKEWLRLQGKLAHAGFGIAFSPDGKTLATNTTGPYGNDEQTTVALWDAKTGEFLRRFRLPTCAVSSLHFSRDGRTLLTTGYEPVIRLWDTATGKPALQWPAHTGEATSVAFTPDGRFLVSGGLDGTVRLWEVSSGRQVRELAGHRWRCGVVAVAPNGKVILSGGADGCIRLQDLDGQQLRRILLDGPPEEMTKHGHNVLALAVGPDSKTAATWSADMGALPPIYHVWDLATGKGMSHHPYRSRVINAPQFSPDARLVLEQHDEATDMAAQVAAGGKGGAGGYGGRPATVTAVLREVATGKEILRLRQADGLGGVHAFAPDCRTILTVSSRRVGDSARFDNALHFWELATMKERLAIPCGPLGDWTWMQRVAFAPDGRTLATARSWDGTIQLWDLVSGKELPQRFASGIEANCLVFAPDSRRLASAHRDGTILVWDLTPRPPSRRGKGESSQGQLHQWWADLAGDDAHRAYAAICELAAEPSQAIPLFRERLLPAAEPSSKKIRGLIADLDNTQFPRRDAAQKELTAYGEQAETPLRAALRDHPSAEQRRRIEQLLDGLYVRSIRAVEVLERIGNPEAGELLERLAKGAPDARQTKEAKASLNRMARQSDAQR